MKTAYRIPDTPTPTSSRARPASRPCRSTAWCRAPSSQPERRRKVNRALRSRPRHRVRRRSRGEIVDLSIDGGAIGARRCSDATRALQFPPMDGAGYRAGFGTSRRCCLAHQYGRRRQPPDRNWNPAASCRTASRRLRLTVLEPSHHLDPGKSSWPLPRIAISFGIPSPRRPRIYRCRTSRASSNGRRRNRFLGARSRRPPAQAAPSPPP